MITCDKALELLSAQLDGALTPEETKALDAHLASCPDCRTVQQELHAIDLGLPTLECEPPGLLHDGVMREIRRQTRRKKEQAAVLRFVGVMAAAAAFLAVLAGFQLVSLPGFDHGEAAVSMGDSLWPKTESQTPERYAEQLAETSGCHVLLVSGCGQDALDGEFEAVGDGLYAQKLDESALEAVQAQYEGSYAMASFGTPGQRGDDAWLLCTD